MSLTVDTKDGKSLTANFTGVFPIDGVYIGDYELSLEDFSSMATHFLGGGLFGWPNNETPECIKKYLSILFALYDTENWTRKDIEQAADELKKKKKGDKK